MWILWQVIFSVRKSKTAHGNLWKNSLKSQVHEKERGHKCEKIFTIKKNLIVHIRVIHEERKDPKCDMCGKFFSQTKSLKRHIHTIHESHKDYKCHSCDKSFSQPGDLKRHIYIVHEGHKDFNCESCGKSYSDVGYLMITSIY